MGCTQLKDANLLKSSHMLENNSKEDRVIHPESCEDDTLSLEKESQTQTMKKNEDVVSRETKSCIPNKVDTNELLENINDTNVTALEEAKYLNETYTRFLNNNTHGCYLVYKPNDNGIFWAVFSHTSVPDALAFATISPYLSVPQYKYKTPQKVCANVDTGVSRYYEAWCLWFIIIKAYEGKTILLPGFFQSNESNNKKFPTMKIYVLFYDKVSSFTQNHYSLILNVRFLNAVCCVSGSYAGFQIYEKFATKASLNDFIACAKMPQNKFYCIF